jgi:dTDP-4-dehydrorhamnose reductase
MNENELIAQYHFLKGRLADVTAQLEEVYVPLVQQAIEHRSEDELREIINRCPDTVINVFIMDAAFQAGILDRKKYPITFPME